MPIVVSGGDANKKAITQRFTTFKNAEAAFKDKFATMTNPQQTAARNAIIGWDFSVASPRENGLFLGMAILYIAMAFVIRQFIRDQG